MKIAQSRDEGGWWLVAYDITEDDRRAAVARLLLRYGHRVQYSVYALHLDDAALSRLVGRLGPMLDVADRLDVVPACERCRRRWRSVGAARVGIKEVVVV